MTITVHMIGNAHLDPVWLWEYAEGIDTVLATARSACDRLEEYPQFIFTCAGSWFYRQVELADPAMFERIRKFIAAGRWAPVGGMVVQPDCNLAMAESYASQFQYGQGYYRRNFGLTTKVGYNVDSFGHTAYMPGFLRDAGMDAYIFCRPEDREKRLSSCLFRWRSPDGREVTAFRLPGPYQASLPDIRGNVEISIGKLSNGNELCDGQKLPDGIEHTLCFYGVGDHGRGPTKAQIEWIIAHQDAIPGLKLVFSHPQAFFDAIAGQKDLLPVVQDEMQMHAVGCYAVERRIKVPMRRAEHKLLQAENALKRFPQATPPEADKQLDCAWEKVLFNQFHDVFCGISLDAASRRASGELEAVCAKADDLISITTRRALRDQAQPGIHKLVVYNPSDTLFEGMVYADSLLYPFSLTNLSLQDERDQPLPVQMVEHRAVIPWTIGLIFPLSVPAGGMRILRRVGETHFLDPAQYTLADRGESTNRIVATGKQLANSLVEVEALETSLRLGGWELSFVVRHDTTDTWSHDTERFNERKAGQFKFRSWIVKEQGPLRGRLLGRGAFGHSGIWCHLVVHDGSPMVRLRLMVDWAQTRQLLQVRMKSPGRITSRVDLVAGGPLDRNLDGIERPLNGGMILGGQHGRLAMVAPEVFSVSADARGSSLTLLRSPYTANDKHGGIRFEQPVTDQGQHYFDIDLYPNFDGDAAKLASLARQSAMPPFVWDLTG
jgi:alpha-mannosidase